MEAAKGRRPLCAARLLAAKLAQRGDCRSESKLRHWAREAKYKNAIFRGHTTITKRMNTSTRIDLQGRNYGGAQGTRFQMWSLLIWGAVSSGNQAS